MWYPLTLSRALVPYSIVAREIAEPKNHAVGTLCQVRLRSPEYVFH